MKRTLVCLLSFALVIVMLVSCASNPKSEGTQSTTTNNAESETKTQSSEAETLSDESEAQLTDSETGRVIETDTESETAQIESDVEYPEASGENGDVITNANNLWAGVNGYYENGTRTDYTIENQNTAITIHAAPDGNAMVGSITNDKGNTYIENTMDVFVRMKNGSTYYASASQNPITFDLYRFGMYYYELRAQKQNFINQYNVYDEKNLDVENNSPRAYYEMSKPKLVNGAIKTTMEDKNDPKIYYNHAPFSTNDYNYIAVDVRVTSPDMSYMRSLTVFVFDNDNNHYEVSHAVANDGEFHTYYFKLDNWSRFADNTIKEFRFDFGGIIGDVLEYKNVRAVKADTGGSPDIRLCRYIHMFSDKTQQVIQISAQKTTEGIEEIGVVTNVEKDRVNAVVVKDKNGLHDTIEGVDWDSVEYVGFDIVDSGIFGYILLPDGDIAVMGNTHCNDTSSGRLVITEEDGRYVIVQSRAPANNRLIAPTGTDNPEVDNYAENFDNCADFYMGHRIYIDENHDFREFIATAETERNPLSAENIVVDAENSTEAKYLGYDALRGMYVFSVAGSNFNRPYYEEPNKHFNVKFSVTGDTYDRNMYIMTTTTHGELQSAVILDANDLLLPIPVEVGKNFSDSGHNYFDAKDDPWSEAYFPMCIKAGDEKTLNFLNIYMNWGRFPLKQISFIQLAPLYHLSTGVTETNCILPWYSNMGSTRNIWTIPDHRAMSAPFWATQPNHTSGGDHRFLRYTDAEGNYYATEVKKNYITSYGPTYAEVVFEHLSDDGRIKATYTHMEMPQTDETRTHYTMQYEILEDVSFTDFKNQFFFYSMNPYNGVTYDKIGYLDENNVCQVVVADRRTDRVRHKILGDEYPYFSFFQDDDCTLERGYINLSFLIKDATFALQGIDGTPRFDLREHNKHLYLTLDLTEVTLKKGDTIKINAIILPWGSQELNNKYDSDGNLVTDKICYETVINSETGEKYNDKNVRDVRENTIINPLTVVPVSGCTVIESNFIPMLHVTNGKKANFTLKGASGNSTVVLSGLTTLGRPMVYEWNDENGAWIRYNLSSQHYTDKNGYGQAYDGYGVQYNADGTYTYSFVVDMSSGEDRTFKFVTSNTFVEEPEPESDSNDSIYGDPGVVEGPNLMLDPEALLEGSTKTSANKAMDTDKSGVMKDDDGTEYFRFFAKNGYNEAWIMPYTIPSKPIKTGRYLVIKYRLPSTNYTSTTELDGSKTTRFEIWTSTQSAVPSGNCLNYYKDYISADDLWHVLIIDLAQMKSLTFNPAPNGDYYANYLRFDMFAEGYGNDSYIDIAYISFDDRAEDIFAYSQNAGLDKVTYYDGRILDVLTTETEFPAPKQVYDEDNTEYETPFNVYISAGQLAHLGSNTNEFGNVTLYSEDGYVRFNSHALNKESDFAIFRNAYGKETGRYIIVKYRASETLATYMQFYATTEAGKSSFTNDNGATSLSNANFVRDGKWQIAIIDLSALTKEFTDVDGKFYASLIRLDVFNDVIGKTSEYVDIAYVAMCDDLQMAVTYDKTVASALAIEGKGIIRRYSTETGEIYTGTEIPSVPVEDVIITVTPEQVAVAAGKGTNIGGAELSADGKYVTVSNKIGAGNGFFFVIDGGVNGVNAGQYVMVKYRTTSADKWLWYIKTAGMSYGYIQVDPIADGEWHVIVIDLSKSPDGTYVIDGSGEYRASAIRWDIMTVASDSKKSVDIEFIATGNDIEKLADSQNVESYVNYDRFDGRVATVDPENHTHIWLDANCVSSKTCALCGTTEGEMLGHAWGVVDGVDVCTRCGKAKYDPIYFQVQFVGSESKAQLVDGRPTRFNDALTTGTSDAGKGKVFFQGWGGTIGDVENIQFRVLSYTDGSVIQDWKDFDQYKTYPIIADNPDNLATVQTKVPGATGAYYVRGWMDISAFTGRTVTIEVAFVMKDAQAGEEHFIFVTETNVTNIESEVT